MTGPGDQGPAADQEAVEGPAEIQALLRRLVADACGMEPEDIETDRPLVDYGLSSRDAVGITGELEEALGRQLPATLLWENPSLAALVRHLTQRTPEASADGDAPAPPGASCPIAVVGIGCRLPGAGGPDAFWDLLLGNGDAVGEVPADRWKGWGEDTDAAAAALPQTTRWGAFLDDIAGFDAQFFGITPREAQLMDPQQRLLLEVAWEALDHAGMPAPTLQGSSTGVYVGLSSIEYGFLTTTDLSRVTEWTSTGSAGSIAANRVSYAFDFHGPSLTVDTACSSSLVALHQACRGLRSGECDTALAAGVNALLSPMITAGFGMAGVLAPNGRCKPFDAAAEGIVRGEGCGVLVLKRLDDALRDGHAVLAVVRGTAVNSDGRSAGIVAPNPTAQQALLRAALRDAGLDAGDIDYVETHGTGTLLGDPIEAGALSAVLGRDRPADRPLLIGSVKSNLGHLEGAAGITGVIKTVLSLHRGQLPATLHFQNPNPHIDFTGGRLRVVSETIPWPGDGHRPARAGVSAFGFGGTNAHAVLEQWNEQGNDDDPSLPASSTQRTATPSPPQILVVSARSADRLGHTALGLADWLTSPAGLGTPLADVTRTLGNHRYGSTCAAVVGRDRDALATGLRALGQQRAPKDVVGPRQMLDAGGGPGARPVFVFTGYGTQWAGMGRSLLVDDEAFAAAVDGLDPVFAADAGVSLSRMITDGVPLTAVARVQPLLYGLQLALARTWFAYGVEPAAVIGHSMGEVAAAVVAGAIDPADGLRVILRRSDLLASVDARRTGAMAAVELPQDERDGVLARFTGVGIAVDASPLRCTVAGPADAVGALVTELEEKGIQARLLDVGGAGHSAAVDTVLPALRDAFQGIRCRPPAIDWYGTVHDDPRQAPWADADYWCANARRTVRFRQAVTAAATDGYRAFLEISPHPAASVPLRESFDAAVDTECLVLPTLLRDSDESLALRTTLAALHTAGVQRRPDLLWPVGRRTSLPTTPWRHTRHWVEGRNRAGGGRAGHPLLGARLDVPGTRRALWQGDAGTEGWCPIDRRVDETPVLTLTACAELVLAAASEVFATAADGLVIRDLALERLLPLTAGTPVTTQLDPAGPGRATVSVHTQSAVGTWTCHATATVELDASHDRTPGVGMPDASFTVDLLPDSAPDTLPRPWAFPPTLLDSCLSAPASSPRSLAAGETATTASSDGFPVAIGMLRVRRPTGAAGVCHVGPSPHGPAAGPPVDQDGAPDRWCVRLEDTEGVCVLEADGVVLRAPEARELPVPVGDKAYEIVWAKTPLVVPRQPAPSHWLLLSAGPGADSESDDSSAAALRAALERTGGAVKSVRCSATSAGSAAAAWRESLDSGTPAAVVLLFPGGTGTVGARETVLTAADAARGLSIVGGSDASARLFLITERAIPVIGGESGNPDRACLRGLLRVLALERPELRPCLIDLDHAPEAVDDLARELLGDGDADHVAWRAGVRFTARLSRVDLGEDATGAPFARPGGAYIVTGGLGGLGLATARRLAERGAGRLVLSGRRPPSTEADAVLAELRALGVEVEVVRGDIAEPGTAGRLVESAVRDGRTLRGVAHAAGVLHDGLISGLTADDLDAVFRPKADGGRHLDEATAGYDLDWWLVFSSAAGLLGSPGQAAYAAANAWLDALVHQRRARGAVGQSIAWGPWSGTGGAPDMTALALDPLPLEEGLDALESIVCGGRSYTGVVRLDAQRLVHAFPGIDSMPFFADLVNVGAGEIVDQWDVEELNRLDGGAALTAVRRRLALRTAMIMGYGDHEVDTTVPLTDLGLDSLMAVRIRNAVKQDFGVALPEALLLRGGALDDVAAALLPALDTESTPAAVAEEQGTVPPLPRDVLPRDAAERLVAGVWAHVSGHRAAGVFQELTGVRDDPTRSVVLAEGIRDRLDGGSAAPTAEEIRRHPTVAAVADLVRPALEGKPDDSPLRVLRDPGSRSDRAPLFVFHPAGGSTSVYQPLTGLLPPGQPVYGLDRVDSRSTVEDKAQHYLDLIRQVQGNGPYRLLGWSFGGCLAYETAARLRELGERIGYLGLIDTILPSALPGPSPDAFLLERFARFAEYIENAYGRRLRLPYEEMANMDEDQQIETLMRHVADTGLDMSPGVLEHQRTSYIDARVGERYRPRPYPEHVVLYRAQEAQALTTAVDPRYLRADADLGWGPLCPDLEVVPVPGDHLSLIDPPHVDVIAGHLIIATEHI